MGERVQILRVHGFVFFGSASGLLERIRKRVETAPPRFLLMDLRQVTGVDASAVMSFVKVIHLAEANGFEMVLTHWSYLYLPWAFPFVVLALVLPSQQPPASPGRYTPGG